LPFNFKAIIVKFRVINFKLIRLTSK
jgi:hypothetical protein